MIHSSKNSRKKGWQDDSEEQFFRHSCSDRSVNITGTFSSILSFFHVIEKLKMNLKIAHLTILLAIALFVPSARAFRCYACTTTNDRNNECAVLKNLQTTLCTVKAYEKLARVPFPIEIKKIFTAVPQDSYPVIEWTCGKLELADTNTGYGPTTNYTIRTCLPKVDGPSFCDRTRDTLEANPNYQPYQVSHCSECNKDSCNEI